MSTSDLFVSVLSPLSNDGDILATYLEDLTRVLADTYANYEIILVDDGSDDDTPRLIEGLLTQFHAVRYLRLSRPHGTETAISSGLETSIGDVTVVVMPDSDPVKLIPTLVSQCREGADIVYGVEPEPRDRTIPLRWATSAFYWYSERFFKMRLPQNATYFQALSRRVVNALLQVKDKYRSLRLTKFYIGYRDQAFDYQPISRRRQARPHTLGELLPLAMAVVEANSRHPLRLVTWLGLFASLVNLLYVVYIVLVYVYKNHVQEGWTTTSMQSALMFLFVFLILTVLSEYIGHILEELNPRPRYYIAEERTSSTLNPMAQRRNVVPEDSSLLKKS